MKISVLETKIICSSPDSALHGYFAWPSVARLRDGSLAMTASGFRLQHICPFGKAVLCRSYDEGKTWSRPTVVIDTPLDDRDSGILPFGEHSLLITSFNNTVAAQRAWNDGKNAYIDAYLDKIDAPAAEACYLGSTFVLSHDNGVTFSEVMRIPISSPHGPTCLPNGEILYIGRTFSKETAPNREEGIYAYLLKPDGNYEKRGKIPDSHPELLSCEPHAIALPSGKLLVHFRLEGGGFFTTYQSESFDNGYTFTEPRCLLAPRGGAPAHLLRLTDGRLISVYGYRQPPFGIKVMVSDDEGATWDTDHDLYINGISPDLGYPASVQLDDGRILTVFYAHPTANAPAVILQTIWKLEP